MANKVFHIFHGLTTVSATFAAAMFLIFYLRGKDSINLIVFVPALIVSAIMILNSYFMYKGQYQTGYFTAMRFFTITGGLFSIVAIFMVGMSFSQPGKADLLGMLMELAHLPLIIFKEPLVVLVYGFPFYAAATAISSYYIER